MKYFHIAGRGVNEDDHLGKVVGSRYESWTYT